LELCYLLVAPKTHGAPGMDYPERIEDAAAVARLDAIFA
jgi:hypothetical protein